jgi:GNAT superfamily N-acetyltransferase
LIRRALPGDMERLVEMAQRFVAESEYARFVSIDPDRLSRTITDIAMSEDGALLVSEVEGRPTGMIAMVAYDHPYSGERTAFEVVWWVEPEARGDGLRLLRAAEEWGREVGAKNIQMVAPNERVGTLYRRLGYAAVETSFQRSL